MIRLFWKSVFEVLTVSLIHSPSPDPVETVNVLLSLRLRELTVVSTERLTVLFESEPSLLVLPAALENLPYATEITPLVVLSAVGVKVAV